MSCNAFQHAAGQYEEVRLDSTIRLNTVAGRKGPRNDNARRSNCLRTTRSDSL